MKIFNNHSTTEFTSVDHLYFVASSSRLSVAPNIHWQRGDLSSLSLWFMCCVLLSSGPLSSFCISELHLRQPKMSLFILKIIKEMFPLFRSGSSFHFNKDFDFKSLKTDLQTTVRVLSGKDNSSFTTGVFSCSDRSNYKDNLIIALKVIIQFLEANDLRGLTAHLISILVVHESLTNYSKVGWEEGKLYFHSTAPESVGLGLKSYYVYDSSVVCSWSDEEVNFTSYALARILGIHQTIECLGYRSSVTGIPSGNGGVFIGTESLETIYLGLIENGLKASESTPARAPVGAGSPRRSGIGRQVREFSSERTLKFGGVYSVEGRRFIYLGEISDGELVATQVAKLKKLLKE
jgi:hypothetical protein